MVLRVKLFVQSHKHNCSNLSKGLQIFLHSLQNILMLTIIKHSLLHNYFKFWFQFQSPATKCPAYVSHNLLSLLDLICPSISKIFQSIFKLLNRTCRLTCIPSVEKFSLLLNCMEYKEKYCERQQNSLKAIW